MRKRDAVAGCCTRFLAALSLHVDREVLARGLKQYQYKSPNLSLFERLWLNRFWSSLPEWLYPAWLAPNVITFTGFCCVAVVTALQMWVSQDMATGLPQWWYALAAVAVFLYQTLDGSDGKQARKTKSGSPVGELFDHGVDAIVSSFTFGLTMAITGLGLHHPLCFVGLLLTQAAFFFSNLTLLHMEAQEYNELDAQEVQVVVQVTLMLSAISPRFIHRPVFLPTWVASPLLALPTALQSGWVYHAADAPSFSIPGLILLISLGFMGVNILLSIIKVTRFYRGRKSNPEVEERLKAGQGVVCFCGQCLTIAAHGVLCYKAWSMACTKDAQFEESASIRAYFIVSAYAFGDTMNHALITRIGQVPFPRLYCTRGAWGMLAFCVAMSVAVTWHRAKWVAVLAMVLLHTQYFFMMKNNLCSCLGIDFFRIKPAKVSAELTDIV